MLLEKSFYGWEMKETGLTLASAGLFLVPGWAVSKRPYKRLLVDVTASLARLDKALAFANDLFNALESAGHRVLIRLGLLRQERIVDSDVGELAFQEANELV